MEPLKARRPRLCLVFTTFPALTETFLQREVLGLKAAGADLQLHSLWGGKTSWQELGIDRFSLLELVTLPYWLIYWSLRRPTVVREISQRLFHAPVTDVLNFAENLLGMGFALLRARRFERQQDIHLHGVWATGPAAAVWLISRLTGHPFSFAAHAYDLYKNGGDGLLRWKAKDARFVRVSTRQAGETLIRRGCPEEKVRLIYRSLAVMPPMKPMRPKRKPLRLVTVGRLVEKMGVDLQVDLYHHLQRQGVDFEARIIGDGPEYLPLKKKIVALGLQQRVHLLGALSYERVEKELQWGDVFVFSGKISRSGDRAGFPNAVAEAMAWGLPVVATKVGGVTEAIKHGQTGILWAGEGIPDELLRLISDYEYCKNLRDHARKWVEASFDICGNMEIFIWNSFK